MQSLNIRSRITPSCINWPPNVPKTKHILYYCISRFYFYYLVIEPIRNASAAWASVSGGLWWRSGGGARGAAVALAAAAALAALCLALHSAHRTRAYQRAADKESLTDSDGTYKPYLLFDCFFLYIILCIELNVSHLFNRFFFMFFSMFFFTVPLYPKVTCLKTVRVTLGNGKNMLVLNIKSKRNY